MAGVPRYAEIRDDVLEKIRRGEYPEGEVIPSELELAAEYEVSRPTVRQALQGLVDDGYLERRRRRGTIVKSAKIESSFALRLESFQEEMAANGRTPSTKVLLLKEEAATQEVAEALGIAVGEPVHKLVRLRYGDDQPEVLVTTYVPKSVAPRLELQDFQTMRLYRYLETEGVPVRRARRHLDLMQAESGVADLLDVSEGDPLYLFHTVGYGEGGEAIEYSVAMYRGASNSFEFEVSC